MHPKDKMDCEEVSECLCQIPCKNCDKVHVGETARNLGIEEVSTKKKWESKDTLTFTQESKKAADELQNKTAITDHVTRENHIIDWNGMKVVGHETNHRTRWLKEAITILKHKGEP